MGEGRPPARGSYRRRRHGLRPRARPASAGLLGNAGDGLRRVPRARLVGPPHGGDRKLLVHDRLRHDVRGSLRALRLDAHRGRVDLGAGRSPGPHGAPARRRPDGDRLAGGGRRAVLGAVGVLPHPDTRRPDAACLGPPRRAGSAAGGASASRRGRGAARGPRPPAGTAAGEFLTALSRGAGGRPRTAARRWPPPPPPSAAGPRGCPGSGPPPPPARAGSPRRGAPRRRPAGERGRGCPGSSPPRTAMPAPLRLRGGRRRRGRVAYPSGPRGRPPPRAGRRRPPPPRLPTRAPLR